MTSPIFLSATLLKLKCEENSWRHRKGDWRILFALTLEIVDGKQVSVIIVARISKHKDD